VLLALVALSGLLVPRVVAGSTGTPVAAGEVTPVRDEAAPVMC
jgi:hypothetical protein